MSEGRSLFSMNLSKDILTDLTRNGYQTLHDLTVANPEILAKGLLTENSFSPAHPNLRPQCHLARNTGSPK